MFLVCFVGDKNVIFEVTGTTETNQFDFPELILDLKYRNIKKTGTVPVSVFEEVVKKSRLELIIKQYKSGPGHFPNNKIFWKLCTRYLRRYYSEELL